jgi:signal transduction histidine kinase/FixJ family two-component response regulator
MAKALDVLFVEDCEDDMLLLVRELKKGGFDPRYRQVCTAEDLLAALQEKAWDIIISDYSMPMFNGLEALKIYQHLGLDIPFIVVSGTIGEDVAVGMMKAGAHDYLLKDATKRLLPAIQRELREAEERRALKKAEIDLAESHQTLGRVLDSIDAAIYVATLDTHRILFVNRYLKELYGRDLVGQICYEAFKERQSPCSSCSNDKLLDKDGNPGEVCVWETQEAKSKRWFINYDRAIKWVDGQLVRLQVATDITRIKKLEEERRQTEAQLRQSQKMEAMGTLAGGIAHDFNNILSAILGYSELGLGLVQTGSTMEQYLQEILRAGNRARDLVQQILTFSRQTESEATPVQVDLIVRETLRLLRASLPSTIDIRQHIRSNALVLADPIQIHQVVMNLGTNAGAAMQEKGGILEVSLENAELDEEFAARDPKLKPGHYLKLTVSDTGHGMTPDVKERIFDPFFTTKAKGQGTGMGLAVVHGIVNSLGGAITVHSQLGQGATFNLFLPPIERRALPLIRPEKPIPRGSERILFIDDERAVTEMGRQMLESLGYQVTTAMDSRKALALFKSNPQQFDLVVTDMTMPGITGEELARELMRLRPLIPVILSTGFSARIDEKKAMAMGIRAFLPKPVLKRELAETLRRVLDENQQRA